MAYSDYGGYAYRNGNRVEERSDAVLSPDGVQSTPGQWPGWTIEAGRNSGSFHVLLGDGPILLGLYKQSSVTVSRYGEELEVSELLELPEAEAISSYEYGGKTFRYLNDEHFRNANKTCVLIVDGHRIEIRWEEADNYYLYARMTQPDGTVWTGFSGYGVGAGLEEAGYGFSTEDCENALLALWPGSIAEQEGVGR